MPHIILYQPLIPQNTGNIARTCAATGMDLHLIGPLGFSIDDRHLKRAGLDYWHLLNVFTYESYEAFRAARPEARPWMASTKGRVCYTEAEYGPDDWLMFGAETTGIPKEILDSDPERTVRIPIREQARCLNLSNAVAVCAFELLRQNGFPGLKK